MLNQKDDDGRGKLRSENLDDVFVENGNSDVSEAYYQFTVRLLNSKKPRLI